MSTNETRSQDSTATIIAGDDAEVIGDTPDWGGSFTEYDRYGEPTGHNYVRCPVCGAEILDGEASTAPHRSACRYEWSVLRARACLETFRKCVLTS